jgi:hypothetical protein
MWYITNAAHCRVVNDDDDDDAPAPAPSRKNDTCSIRSYAVPTMLDDFIPSQPV